MFQGFGALEVESSLEFADFCFNLCPVLVSLEVKLVGVADRFFPLAHELAEAESLVVLVILHVFKEDFIRLRAKTFQAVHEDGEFGVLKKFEALKLFHGVDSRVKAAIEQVKRLHRAEFW
ncbi:MAG: hypothetical protein LAO78_17325 [Acidobacteriia bacterium]|nr:hypothetical protein [Terriglobia bacterium]